MFKVRVFCKGQTNFKKIYHKWEIFFQYCGILTRLTIKIKLPPQTDFQPNVLILILTVRFKFRMLWLLALTCQCISHFSLVNGPQGNREMPNKLMIGPDQSLLFNFRRNHLHTRPPREVQVIYFQNVSKDFERKFYKTD